MEGFDAGGTALPLQLLGSLPLQPDTWQVKVRLNQTTAAQYTLRAYAVCAGN